MNDHQFRKKVLLKKGMLYRYALRILGNEEDAEDVTSEAILLLWDKRTQLSRYEYLDRFLFTVIKNLSIDWIRRRRSFQPLSKNIHSSSDWPSIDAGSESKFGMVKKIINGLPEKQRMAIHLRMTEGYSIQKIADIMDEKVNTIEVTLSRARKKIREEYAKYTIK